MRVAVVVLALASGCDAVLGLGPIPRQRVTGSVVEHYAANNADGTPMVADRVLDPSELSLVATLSDGTTPAVDYRSDGTFSFEIGAPGQVYRLALVANGAIVEHQLASQTPRFAVRLQGRPDRAPVTLATPISFAYGPGSPNTSANVASTGLWTFTTNVAFNTATFDFDWQTANGVKGLLDASAGDRLYAIQMAPFSSSGTTPDYDAISAWADASVTLSDGTPLAVSGTLTPAAKDLCAHVVALRGEELARLKAAIPPGTYTFEAVDWAIHSVPSRAVAPAGLQRIVVGGENFTSVGTDIDIDATFTNPFPGSQLIAQLQAVEGYVALLPGTTSGPQLSHQTNTYIELDVSKSSCIANLASLDGTVAIPQAIALDGTLLDTDGQVIVADPGRDLELTWSSSAGAVDYGTVIVDELAAVGTATTISQLAQITSATPGSAIVGADLLVPGHSYVLIVSDRIGLPHAGAGDFDTIVYPFAAGTVTTRYFQVASP